MIIYHAILLVLERVSIQFVMHVLITRHISVMWSIRFVLHVLITRHITIVWSNMLFSNIYLLLWHAMVYLLYQKFFNYKMFSQFFFLVSLLESTSLWVVIRSGVGLFLLKFRSFQTLHKWDHSGSCCCCIILVLFKI